VAVLKSEDDRITFYVTPVAVEFEDEDPRWLEYEMGFQVGLEQGVQLVAGSEGLSLSMMESELMELITRLHRLLEGLAAAEQEPGRMVLFEGTDPDFNLSIWPERVAQEETEVEPAHPGRALEMRVEVLVDLTSLQRTGATREPGRAHVGFHFYTTPTRLEGFVTELKQEYQQATGEEFILRQEPPLPAEVPFSRILNLLNRKDWTQRHLAVRLLAQVGDARAITLLVQELNDANGWVRERAVQALRELTGQQFRFDAFALACDRRRALRRWQQWWQANRLSFVSSGNVGEVKQ